MPVRQIDTNVVSCRFKRHPLWRTYRRHLAGYVLAVSFQTVGELYAWAELAGWGSTKRAELDAFIQAALVYDSDDAICRRWADVRVARRAQPISVDDTWVAATALAHGVELVTHNPRHFASIPGLTVITEAP